MEERYRTKIARNVRSHPPSGSAPGQWRTPHLPAPNPLPQFLEQLGLNPRLVAVEYNGEILHRQFWDTTEIQADDRLEIVTIVGGGLTRLSSP